MPCGGRDCGGSHNPDVKRFVNNADLCEHFLGEIDNSLSKSEQKRIVSSVNKYCDRAKKQLCTLKVKYRNDAEVQTILSQYHDTLSDDAE